MLLLCCSHFSSEHIHISSLFFISNLDCYVFIVWMCAERRNELKKKLEFGESHHHHHHHRHHLNSIEQWAYVESGVCRFHIVAYEYMHNLRTPEPPSSPSPTNPCTLFFSLVTSVNAYHVRHIQTFSDSLPTAGSQLNATFPSQARTNTKGI